MDQPDPRPDADPAARIAALEAELAAARREQAALTIENARLFEAEQARTGELQASLEYQTAISEVLGVISRSPTDLQPVFETIAESAARLCGARWSCVNRFDGKIIELAAIHNLSNAEGVAEVTRTFPRRPRPGGVVDKAIVDRDVSYMRDSRAADLAYPHAAAAHASGTISLLTVPMLRRGEPVGAISVSSDTSNAFSDRQIALLRAFADQAVIAINNVGLFDEVQARTRELTESLDYQMAISRVLGVLSRSQFQSGPVLDTIVSTAAGLIGADRAAIRIKAGEQFQIAAQFGYNNEEIAYLRTTVSDEPPISIKQTIRTRQSTRMVLSDDPVADRVGVKVSMAVPLLRDGDLIGVLGFWRTRPVEFTERQATLAETFADQAVIAIENARLLDELQTRQRELEARSAELAESLEYQTAMSEVLEVISRSPSDLQPVLDAVVATAFRLCEVSDAYIFLEQTGELQLRAHRGSRAAPPGFRTPINRGSTVGRAFIDQKPVHVHDLLAMKDDMPQGYQYASNTGQRTTFAVPLMRDGRPIGCMFLRRTEVRPFSEKQIALLSTFANQAVIAINNVGLFEQVQARTRDLAQSLEYQTAISDVLSVISRSKSELQPVLDTIVSTAARLCSPDVAGVLLRRDGKYHIQAFHGFDEAYRRYALDNPVEPGRGNIIGRAAVEKRTVHVNDVLADPEWTTIEGQKIAGYRTIVSTPLLRDGDVIGVISLGRTTVAPFTPPQIALLETFANQAIIAIENARLLNELQTRQSELEKQSNDLARSLNYQTAISGVLEVISRSKSDLRPILDRIVETAAVLGAADLVGLRRKGEAGFELAAYHGYSEQQRQLMKAQQHNYPSATSMLARAIQEKRTIHTPNVPENADGLWTTAIDTLNIGAALCVPLLRGEEVIGSIMLLRHRTEGFSQEQIKLIETFADQAVIAIENARLLDELQTRQRELTESLEYQTVSGEVLGVISRSPTDAKPVFMRIAESAAKLCNSEYAIIYRFDGELLHIASDYGLSGDDRELMHRIFPMRPNRSTAASRCIHSGRVEEIPDTLGDSEYSRMAARAMFRSTVGVPIPDHASDARASRLI